MFKKIKSSQIIDVHLLYGEDFWLKQNKPDLAHKNSTSGNQLVSFILPFPSSKDNLYIPENEIIAKASLSSDHLVPVFALNPLSEENIENVWRLTDNLKFFGIIIWPILCNIDLKKLIDNKPFRDFLHAQEDNEHFFVEIHTGAGNEKDIGRVRELGNYLPLDVVNVAKAFPKIKFILTHALRLSVPALTEAKKLSNVVIDTNGISCQKRWFENGQNVFPAYDAGKMKDMNSDEIFQYLYNELGLSEKLVFGSSYPYSLWWGFDVEHEINLVKNCGLPSSATNKILKENIIRFLNIN